MKVVYRFKKLRTGRLVGNIKIHNIYIERETEREMKLDKNGK